MNILQLQQQAREKYASLAEKYDWSLEGGQGTSTGVLLDELIAQAFQAGKDTAVEYIKTKGQYEGARHTLIYNGHLEEARNTD